MSIQSSGPYRPLSPLSAGDTSVVQSPVRCRRTPAMNARDIDTVREVVHDLSERRIHCARHDAMGPDEFHALIERVRPRRGVFHFLSQLFTWRT